MDRVGDAVTRELGRFGPETGVAHLVERWPAAVGAEISRNAWPARIGRDGTLHVHTKDSIWAFELTSRAEEIRRRFGDVAPKRLAFAPGPLPEPATERVEAPKSAPPKPSSAHVAKADSLTRGIRDPELREAVAKTVALSLSRDADNRMFW